MNTPSFTIVEPSAERFFGLTSSERTRRSARRCGIEAEVSLEQARVLPGAILLVRGDFVLDDAIFSAMVKRQGAALAAPGIDSAPVIVNSANPDDREEAIALLQGTASGPGKIPVLSPADIASHGAENSLRKRFNPLILKISDHTIADLEARLFAASYKGVTDFVTKRVWPWPAIRATRWCAARGITPNQVTLVSLILVLAAFWLFWRGAFLPGLAAAWAMCFLDTVDGKLARVTLTSTKWGNVFDHGIDLIHPPFWYWAWHHGLGDAQTDLDWALWVAIVGYVVGRLQEGWFLWRFKFEIHTWQKIDSWFREITARRNPNLAILSVAALAASPAAGLAAVACWTIASLAFHFLRIAQAERARRDGAKISSWLAGEAPAA